MGDQSLIFNGRWGLPHVYIAIFSGFGSSTSLLFVLLVSLCSDSFSPSWLGFWHCPLSFHTQCQISEVTGSFLIQGVPGLSRTQIRAHEIVLDSRVSWTFSETYPSSRDCSWFKGFLDFSGDRSELTRSFLIQGVPGLFRRQIRAHGIVLDSRGSWTFPETDPSSRDRSWFKGFPDLRSDLVSLT